MTSALAVNGRGGGGGGVVNGRTKRRDVDGSGIDDDPVEVPAWKRDLLLKRRTYNWMATLLGRPQPSSSIGRTATAAALTNSRRETMEDEAARRHSSEVCCNSNHASTGNSNTVHAQLNNNSCVGGGGGGGGASTDTVQLTSGGVRDAERVVDFIRTMDVSPSSTVLTAGNDGGTRSPAHSESFLDVLDVDVDVEEDGEEEEESEDDDRDDCTGEWEYGPGIVNRLRSKFINMTIKMGGAAPVRRVASMEYLLDDDRAMTKSNRGLMFVNGGQRSIAGNRRPMEQQRSASVSPTISSDVIKRARSMETLCGPMYNSAFRPSMIRSYSCAKDDLLSSSSSSSPLTSLALVNENVVIIEQPRPAAVAVETIGKGPSLSTLRVAMDAGHNVALQAEDEFPKPDTVRTFKRIFEAPTEEETSKKPVLQRKVTPPPKPVGLKPTPRPAPILNGCCAGVGGAKYGPRPSKIPSPARRIPSRSKVETDEVFVPMEPAAAAAPPPPPPPDIKDDKSSSIDVLQKMSFDNSVAKIENLDYVLSHLKPIPTTTPLEVATPTQDRPKVVSIQPKSDEKPVGHIRPFQNVEQQKNRVNDLKSEEPPQVTQEEVHSAVTESTTTTTSAVTVKKPSPQRSAAPTTQTFNFVGKDVQPHIANTTAPFAVKRPTTSRNVDKVDGNSSRNKENFGPNSDGATASAASYIIAGTDVDASWRHYVDEDDDDEDDDNDDDALLRDGDSAQIVFVGSNIIAGRSALLKNRNKKLKIAFDDTAVSTYEYPSEGSLMQMSPPESGDSVVAAGQPSESTTTDENHTDDSRSQLTSPHHATTMVTEAELLASRTSTSSLKSTPAIGSTGGLSSYTPMAVAGSGNTFELGVSPPTPSARSPLAAKTKEEEEAAAAAAEEDIFLKPASDEQNSAWSNTETVDLLF